MNDLSHIKDRLMTKASYIGTPISGNFELTPRCNFSCKMCYIHMTPEEMKALGQEHTADEWIRLGKECRDAGMVFLLLTGGEPFLRPDFPEIYQALAEMGLSISINTNGSLLNEELKELFTSLPPANLNISLYASSPEGYKELCGVAGGYERTMDTLAWFRENNILVNLNATITPYNAPYVRQIERFALDNHYNLRLTTYSFPPVRRPDAPEILRFDPVDAGKLRAENVYYQFGADTVCAMAKDLDNARPERELILPECGDPMRCHAGRSMFWVTWDGKMTPCGMLSSPTAHPFETGFLPAWEQIRRETEQIRLCPDCLACKERSTCLSCAAVTVAETGRFDGKPEYLCKLNSAYREKLIEISREIMKK